MRALRTAAALVVVGAVVAGAIVVRRGAPVEARATTPEAGASTDTAEAPAPAKPTFKEVLADAKAWAAAEEWDLVIGMLSENGPAWTKREALPWNTLLAQAALLQAQRLPKIDARRNALFVTARDRATLALVSIEPFAEEADVLRLLRAEACIIGDLGCESTRLTEDILLAARSPYVAVSDRAIELLESVEP